MNNWLEIIINYEYACVVFSGCKNNRVSAQKMASNEIMLAILIIRTIIIINIIHYNNFCIKNHINIIKKK